MTASEYSFHGKPERQRTKGDKAPVKRNANTVSTSSIRCLDQRLKFLDQFVPRFGLAHKAVVTNRNIVGKLQKSRENKDGNIRTKFLHRLRELGAVHPWHLVIEYCGVEPR